MTQTETPRKVTTPAEAADLFRKHEYCGYGEWIVNGDAVVAMDGGFVARCYALNHAVIIANDYSGYYGTLEAENQRLKADCDHEYQCANSYHKKWTRNADEVESLRQERDTLREAARAVVDNNGGPIDSMHGEDTHVMVKMEDFNALAALAQQPEVSYPHE